MVSEANRSVPQCSEALLYWGTDPFIRALELVKTGMTIRDVLAHGIINYHPVIVGTAEEVADFMEEWFVKGACDGFAIQPDVSFDGIADFVDQVIPILQERGLFHDDYEGTTLRDHMGVSYQYGLAKEI